MSTVTVESSIAIAAPPAAVFQYVAIWQNAPCYVSHIADLHQVGAPGYGLGTRVRGRARFHNRLLNVLPLETTSEVVGFDENERIVCRSLDGIENANTWLFRPHAGGTLVTAILTYRLPGRFIGGAVARLLARELAESLPISLDKLKAILERYPGALQQGGEHHASAAT